MSAHPTWRVTWQPSHGNFTQPNLMTIYMVLLSTTQVVYNRSILRNLPEVSISA